MVIWDNFLTFYEKICIKILYKITKLLYYPYIYKYLLTVMVSSCLRWAARTRLPTVLFGLDGVVWLVGGYYVSRFDNRNRSMCRTRRVLYESKKSR